jgi:hypothetical protein
MQPAAYPPPAATAAATYPAPLIPRADQPPYSPQHPLPVPVPAAPAVLPPAAVVADPKPNPAVAGTY